jgi:hypothetical protein
MTHGEVFEALKLVYWMEQAAGTWANLMPSKLEITILTTNLAKANIKLIKMKLLGGGGSKGGGGGRDSSGDRGGSTGRGNSNRGAGKGGGGTNNEECEWMLKKDHQHHQASHQRLQHEVVQVVWTGPFQGAPRRHVHAGTPRSCKMAPLQKGVIGKIQCQKEIPKKGQTFYGQ